MQIVGLPDLQLCAPHGATVIGNTPQPPRAHALAHIYTAEAPATSEDVEPLAIEPASILRAMLALRDPGRSEEAGCLLWDLAASHAAALVMLQAGLLDLLTALLPGFLPQQEGDPVNARQVELCLGTAANLATHAEVRCELARAGSLAAAVAGPVLQGVDDPGALAECCRLLAAACQPEVSAVAPSAAAALLCS